MGWGERQLSVEEHDRLCAAFLKLQGMRDRNNRDLYIEALGDLSFPRHADAYHDVWALLTACFNYPSGLRKLLGIVRAFHKDSLPMARLDELVECLFPEELIDLAERHELLGLLAGVDARALGNAYRQASPPSWWHMAIDWTDLDGLVRHLESCAGHTGALPPLFAFVDCVAHQLDAGTFACHRWLDRVGLRLGLAGQRMAELCTGSVTGLVEAADPYFVVVQLQPDGIDPDRFLMSAWLQQRSAEAEQMRRDDLPRTLPEIAGELSYLLRSVSAEDVTVEFILPRSLIGHPIDQWQIDEVFPHRIGTSYPVVVRSLDRMHRPDLHGHWKRKWRWLSTNGHHVDPGAIRWVRGQSVPDALRSELLVDHRPVAVAMGFPPEDCAGLIQDELTAALYAGVPVIIWCRDRTLADRFEHDIGEALAGRGLVELPEQVLRLRRVAGSSDRPDAHPGEHVTLLWDDAERIPESFTRSTRLQAPQ